MDNDATIGELHRIAFGAAQRPRPTGGVRATEAGEFARVYELAEARRRRGEGLDGIPSEVWDAIGRASELVEELAARGQQVRFDTHHLTGRVVATLCDTDGEVLRPVPLSELFGSPPDFDPLPAA